MPFCSISQKNTSFKVIQGKEVFHKYYFLNNQVYLVKNKITKELFAAKVVSKLDKNKSPTKNLVLEERKILQNLESEFVYHFYQFYEETDDYVFILEHLTGKDLMTLFKDNT